MNIRDRLAIVIPAYKKHFFKEALESIANQTSQDFTLYIGDDHSPDDLYSIANNFKGRIDIRYHRFDENLGGRDLVAHWTRCIELTRDEEWIWLFSDDDVMDSNCVEIFRQHLNQYDESTLFHFDVKVINENSEIVGKFQPFPATLTPEDFFSKRIRFEISSYVVEYIFSRKMFNDADGFQKFDQAWGSDDASWMKFSYRNGITTLPQAYVQWRYSGINISSKVEDKSSLLRKLKASEEYIRWAADFLQANGRKETTSDFEKLKWILTQFMESKALSIKEKWRYIKGLLQRLQYRNLEMKMALYLLYMEAKKSLRNK